MAVVTAACEKASLPLSPPRHFSGDASGASSQERQREKERRREQQGCEPLDAGSRSAPAAAVRLWQRDRLHTEIRSGAARARRREEERTMGRHGHSPSPFFFSLLFSTPPLSPSLPLYPFIPLQTNRLTLFHRFQSHRSDALSSSNSRPLPKQSFFSLLSPFPLLLPPHLSR